MRILTGFVTFAALVSLATLATAADKSEKKHKDDWQPIFDGKTLDGWKASDHPESWSIKDGVIHGDGPGSYLFYMNAHCFNCEFKADVKIGHEGNSGMFFRSPFSKSPADYEAQIDSSHRDPVRTGSLYHFVKILEVLVPDDTWFTQRIVVEGNHIQVFVNDKQTVDFIDEKNTKTDGLFALQQHNAGSIVEFKNVMWKVLPPPKSPLVGTWKLNLAQSKFSAGDTPKESELRILEERDGIRYQSSIVMPDGKKRGVNYFGRLDGYDYVAAGSTDYDHIAIEEVDRHKIHEALKVAKIRKKATDEHVYHVVARMGFKEVGQATYTISVDGKTLTRDATIKSASGEEYHNTEVFEKIEQ
jgi:Domain of Unknown Function (DUF1080)